MFFIKELTTFATILALCSLTDMRVEVPFLGYPKSGAARDSV
jgi:hypothetical protein